MIKMKLIVVLTVLFVVLSNAKDTFQDRPCKFVYDCDIVDEPTWATDGKQCYLFSSPCQFANQNCARLNRFEPMFKVIPKEQCKALCNSKCPDIEKPVCGIRGPETHEFSNQCLMDFYICNTEKTFIGQFTNACHGKAIKH